MQALYNYFEENMARSPIPVTDFSLRVEKLENGSFHFYIHPAITDGKTLDFILTKVGLTPLDNRHILG